MTPSHYLCPYCRAHLCPNNKIILGAKTPEGNKGLILLSPELGEYSVVKHESFVLNEGDILETYCPVCSSDLGYEKNKKLAKVIMIDRDNVEYDIYFSEIVGQRCTYKIHGDHIEAFGEDAGAYTNFWGATPRY